MYKIMIPKSGNGEGMLILRDGSTLTCRLTTARFDGWNEVTVDCDSKKPSKAAKRVVRTGAKVRVTPEFQHEVRQYLADSQLNQRELAESIGNGITNGDISVLVSRKTPFNTLATTVNSVREAICNGRSK